MMKPVVGKQRFTRLWILGLGMALVPLGHADVRVAVVPGEVQTRTLAMIEVAEPALMAEPGVHWLERRAVETLLSEQGWSLSGMVNAADAVQAGRLL